MATTNPALTATWTKIVDSGKDFLLTLPFSSRFEIEVAVSDTDVVPTVVGHRVAADHHEGLSRSLVGPGYVYARTLGGSVIAVLTAWTP